jgi:hypothetical protein
MPSELDIQGVFVPSFFAVALAAYILTHLLSGLLARTSFYNFVWHRALLNVALFVCITGALFSFSQWLSS